MTEENNKLKIEKEKKMEIPKVEDKAKSVEKPKEILKKTKSTEVKEIEKAEEGKKEEVKEDSKLDKKEDKKTGKKEISSKPKVKKTTAVVRAHNAPISTKHSIALTYFIKNKPILKAIENLEEVLKMKRAVPMKGEIPHRKGDIMSGRYIKNATSYFLMLLRSLASNANANEIENPIIISAVANIGVRPRGRFGRIRRKRTHIEIVVKDKLKMKKTKNKSPKNKIKKDKK